MPTRNQTERLDEQVKSLLMSQAPDAEDHGPPILARRITLPREGGSEGIRDHVNAFCDYHPLSPRSQPIELYDQALGASVRRSSQQRPHPTDIIVKGVHPLRNDHRKPEA